MPRVTSRELLPTAVKGRNISDIIFKGRRLTATAFLADNGQITLNVTFTHDKIYPLLGTPFISIYIGSIAEANQLPGGSAIDESQWQIIGPQMYQERWETEGYPKHIDFSTMYIRSISSGNVTLIFVIDVKYLSSRERFN